MSAFTGFFISTNLIISFHVHLRRPSQMKEVYRQMQEQLNQGFQIYAVTPLITESETLDLKNAEELHEKLSH